MSGKHERHAKAKYDYDAPPSRSAELAAAITEPGKQPPGRKDRRNQCKAAHNAPHAYVIMRKVSRQGHECEWLASWRFGAMVFAAQWHCEHEEACENCGRKTFRRLALEECPAYPGDPAQELEAERHAENLEAIRTRTRWPYRRKPPITGPQGYRRRRASQPEEHT